MLKRSSLVIPGFLGTPAGMTTISAPTRESFSCSSPVNQKCIKRINQVGRIKNYDSVKITIGNKNIPTNPVDVEAVSQ